MAETRDVSPRDVERRRVLTAGAGAGTAGLLGVASLVLPAAAAHASNLTPLASPSTLVLALDAGAPASYTAGAGTWTDLSGVGNHVTLPAGTTSPTFDAGGWFAFDPASSQRLDVPSAVPAAIAAAAGAYTKEAWVRFDASGANASYNILSTPSDVLFLSLSSGAITLYGSPGGSPYTATTASTGALTSSTWHHVAFASDGASLHRLFVDGTRVSTGTNSRTFTGGTLRIGAHESGGNPVSFWRGDIAQVRVYASALTDADVLGNFTATRSRYGV